MIDKIRRDIQARLEELLGEIDRLRRALAALSSRGSQPASGARAAPADARTASVGEGAAESSRATTLLGAHTRPRSASSPAAASAQKPASSAAAPARARTAPGATKAAVLAALNDGSAMTAGEIAAATGLGRATVSTTLSKLAASGEITKAAGGYQIPRRPMLLVWMAPGRPASRRIRLSCRGDIAVGISQSRTSRRLGAARVSRPRLERAAEAPPVVLVVRALVASAIVGVRFGVA